ncbi:MAG: sigma-54-dependent Fis family transcriptional regulator [Alphaproteobacteria bacterium]|nr:sigma-54-dependent Fis family transcriptional regulator [Alphaproteobacteria bacterium]
MSAPSQSLAALFVSTTDTSRLELWNNVGLLSRVLKVGKTDYPALIRGERGSGKEVTARAIHDCSPRKKEPFVPLNCASISPELIGATLLGHEKGAFTGAVEKRPGIFQGAGNGTVFLDEIGDMPLSAQAVLLRVLQEKKVTPLGGIHELPIHCRILAATNQDLESLVESGKFRADLFDRLNVLSIQTEPLRGNHKEILILAKKFLQQYDGTGEKNFSSDAIGAMTRHTWPGNIRELENAVIHAIVNCDGNTIEPADLRLRSIQQKMTLAYQAAAKPEQPLPEENSYTYTNADGAPLPMREVERIHILRALEYFGYNKERTGRALGISRTAFHRKVTDFGIERKNAHKGEPSANLC